MRLLTLISSLLVMPIGAHAQAGLPQFSTPDGCTSVLTTQYRGCSVSHVYRCDAHPGELIELNLEDDGAQVLIHYSEQFSVLRMQWLTQDLTILPEGEASDPLSFDELLETGLDSFSYQERINGEMVVDVNGFDKLIDTEVTIDGRVLKMTEFDYRVTGPDGDLMMHNSGQQFVDPELRIIFSGLFVDHLDAEGTVDRSPAEFIFEGEPEFLTMVPRFDCNATL